MRSEVGLLRRVAVRLPTDNVLDVGADETISMDLR